MKQYSGVFIAETVKLYLRHGSLRKTAFKQCVSKSSLQRWVKRLGSMIRQPRRTTKRRTTRMSKVPAEQIKASLERNPFITLRDMAEVFNCSVATACRAVRRAGFSFKKASHRPQARDQQERLQCFISTCASIDLDDAISLDETGFRSLVAPRYGYAPVGRRLDRRFPSGCSGSWTSCSAIVAMSTRGVEAHSVVAGSVTTSFFCDFLTQLKDAPQRYVLMDNIAFHHSARALEALRNIGKTVVFTPPYSPELNPVENLFGVLKHHWRRLGPAPRDLGSLCTDVDVFLICAAEAVRNSCTPYFESWRLRVRTIL